MWTKLKQWYLHPYQDLVFAINVAKSEYDKIGSFVTPTLLCISVLKLFWKTLPWWIIPVLLLTATISAIWIGKWLIVLGIPKKTAQLGNMQNPEIIELLTIVRELKDKK